MNTYVHEELYRGKDLFEKIKTRRIVVCGCGAIGSNLVDNLIRQGFKSILALDYDRVEDHNRHTQIWGRRDIGQLKVRALSARMYNNSGVQIDTMNKKLDERNVGKYLDKDALIIDCFDNSASRKIINDYCLSNGMNCLHVGLNEGYAEVIWNEQYRVPKDVEAMDVCEYPLARNIVMLSVIIAAEVILIYLENEEKRGYTITLGDLKILPIEDV